MMGNYLQTLIDADPALQEAERWYDNSEAEKAQRQRLETRRIEKKQQERAMALKLAKSSNPLFPDDHPLAPLFNELFKRLRDIDGAMSRLESKSADEDEVAKIIAKHKVETKALIDIYRKQNKDARIVVGTMVEEANAAAMAGARASYDIVAGFCANFVGEL